MTRHVFPTKTHVYIYIYICVYLSISISIYYIIFYIPLNLWFVPHFHSPVRGAPSIWHALGIFWASWTPGDGVNHHLSFLFCLLSITLYVWTHNEALTWFNYIYVCNYSSWSTPTSLNVNTVGCVSYVIYHSLPVMVGFNTGSPTNKNTRIP